MLDLVDESLESFLRASVPLSAQDVDLSFEAPERDWSAKLTRPTVNAFLWDIRRSSDRARAGLEEFEEAGRLVRRLALPRVELRYLVTAWTNDHRDERALLSGVMRAVLAHHEIPPDYVSAGLVPVGALTMLMARAGEDQMEVFKTLGGQLKPGISLVLTTAVDIGRSTPAGPPVEAFETSFANMATGATHAGVRRVAGEVHLPDAAGAVVWSPHGKAVVNAAHRFLVAAETGDEIVVETSPPRSVVVPPAGGVVVR